jgi:hypothetical protein
MEIKPKPKHFKIKTINWISNKEKVEDFNLVFSGKTEN